MFIQIRFIILNFIIKKGSIFLMKELFEKKISWNNQEIDQIKYDLLQNILEIDTQEAIEATIKYAKYLNKIGINNNNYPAFLRIIGLKNKYIIDALLGTQNPFLLMNNLQPDYFITSTCFSYLSKFKPGEIYHKTLKIILGYLQSTYNISASGYKIYPPTKFDINNVCKNFDKEKEKDDPINITILNFLEKISNLENESSDENMEDLAIHTHNIRNNLLDITKKIDEILPSVLLKNDKKNKQDIQPRKLVQLSKMEKNKKFIE